MRYKFIRTGHRPIEETDHDYNIRAGFIHCTQPVRDNLEAFFVDPGQKSVAFKFEDHTVVISRDIK